jgi:uncharacterized protein YbjT (DUF2867 family)
MMKIMIIGATGSIGRSVRAELLNTTDAQLKLVSRHAASLSVDATREEAVNLNVMDTAALTQALNGVDAVFAAVSGDMADMARSIVAAMTAAGVQRVVFISSMGIYDEVPASVGGSNLSDSPVLLPYRRAADAFTESSLNYTVIRPAWFDNGSDDYEVTREGEAFGGHDVSRHAIAMLAAATLQDEHLYSKESVGINRPQ